MVRLGAYRRASSWLSLGQDVQQGFAGVDSLTYFTS
jgi:hypothetical protein